MRHIDTAERRARLGVRHLLAGPGSRPVEVAAAMVGLHSSDPATVYLSLQARLDSFSREDLEEALYEERSLLRLLGMRRTMFVVPQEIAPAMEAGCTRLLAPAERRRLERMVTEQGITDDGERWVNDVCAATLAALEQRGEAVASELSQDVPELKLKLSFGEGKKWGGKVGVSTRILFLLATDARIVRARPRGTWISSQYRWAPTAAWIRSPLPEIDKETAQADLLHRWLTRFGPGTMTDLKWWTGWTVRDTKAALANIDVAEVELDQGTGFVLADDLDPVAPPKPWAALLPALDPTPMGWKDRAWFLGGHDEDLFDRNGNIGPTVWLNGRIVGGWGQDGDGEVVTQLLEELNPAERRLVEARRFCLGHWLGGDRVTPRFRTPLEKKLAD